MIDWFSSIIEVKVIGIGVFNYKIECDIFYKIGFVVYKFEVRIRIY